MSQPQRTPTVSVVIPTWNSARTLDRALNSVRAQSLSAAEVWIVDDASTDETVAQARAYIQQHQLHHWHVQAFDDNQGPSRGRNWGWDQATGEYVAFLDADDSWHPQKLEIQATWMQANPAIALSGHGHKLLAPDAPSPNAEAPRTGHATLTPSRVLMRNPFITPSVMVRRACPLRFETGRRHMEDHFLWMRMALHGHPIARLNADLAYIHKAAWGESGLSAQMWRMERAELKNYSDLFHENLIGIWPMRGLQLWSLLKHFRRILMKCLRIK